MDEVFLKINGEQKYLRRAVDADGNVLDIRVGVDRAAAEPGRRTSLSSPTSSTFSA